MVGTEKSLNYLVIKLNRLFALCTHFYWIKRKSDFLYTLVVTSLETILIIKNKKILKIVQIKLVPIVLFYRFVYFLILLTLLLLLYYQYYAVSSVEVYIIYYNN